MLCPPGLEDDHTAQCCIANTTCHAPSPLSKYRLIYTASSLKWHFTFRSYPLHSWTVWVYYPRLAVYTGLMLHLMTRMMAAVDDDEDGDNGG
jgi:hypothetical protein